MNLFMVNIYTNILVVLPLRKILQRVDHLVNEIEHAESQSQSSLVFCAFFNSRFFAQMKTIILEFLSIIPYFTSQEQTPLLINYFLFHFQKSKSRSSSVPAGARRQVFQVPKAPSGMYKSGKQKPRQLFYVSISRKKSFLFCHHIYFLLVFDKSIVNGMSEKQQGFFVKFDLKMSKIPHEKVANNFQLMMQNKMN